MYSFPLLNRLSDKAREHCEMGESDKCSSGGGQNSPGPHSSLAFQHNNEGVMSGCVTCLDTYLGSSTFRERQLNDSGAFVRCVLEVSK